MKYSLKNALYILCLGVLAPWLVVSLFEWIAFGNAGSDTHPHIPTTEQTSSHENAANDIFVLLDGNITQMPLEEYVAGVLLCELPESFSLEAKKAQAVVARTYALRACLNTGKHAGMAVCTDPDCCQGYTPPEKYQGTEKGLTEAMDAALSTAGEVLTFEGSLIEATYFSCSGGLTEDAVAVWGSDVPYLRSVPSPGEEGAAHYTDTVTFRLRDFLKALSLPEEQTYKKLIGSISYTRGGGISSIMIGDTMFTGTQIRSALKLRSTAFSISVVGDNVYITTKGFGHRVGLSQYGAEAMARSGKLYQDILAHYYQDTVLEKG